MNKDKDRSKFVNDEIEGKKKIFEREEKKKSKDNITFKPDKKFIKELNKEK